MRSLKVPLFVVFLFLLSTVSVFACMCGGVAPCETAKYADVVFIGTATKKESIKTGKTISDGGQTFEIVDRFTTLKIDEIFIGEKTESIKLKESNSTCDFPFKEGETYFVLGNFDENGKTYYTSICSGTSLISKAQKLLDYYRTANYHQSTFKGSIHNIVYSDNVLRNRESIEKPIKGSKIILESNKKSFQTLSDVDGNFELSNIPQGTYIVKTDKNVNFSLLDYNSLTPKNSWKVEIPKRGCVQTQFTARPTGKISGRILAHNNNDLYELRLSLRYASRSGDFKKGYYGYANVKENGEFEFNFVPSGVFHLGVNLDIGPLIFNPYPEYYFPGVLDKNLASTVSLKPNQKIKNIVLKYPPILEPIILEGIAYLKDGTPAKDQLVALFISNINNGNKEGSSAKTDDLFRTISTRSNAKSNI